MNKIAKRIWLWFMIFTFTTSTLSSGANGGPPGTNNYGAGNTTTTAVPSSPSRPLQASAAAFVPGGGTNLTPNGPSRTTSSVVEHQPLQSKQSVASNDQATPTSTVGPPVAGLVVCLEEIAFFLEDMDRTVWWLLKVAKVYSITTRSFYIILWLQQYIVQFFNFFLVLE